MRAAIIVMDSLGVGELPDASRYSDAGADTLGHILDNYEMDIPNLRRLGIGNVERPEDPSGLVAGGRLAVDEPEGVYGRLAEKSLGKDTITGHWEIAGIETEVGDPGRGAELPEMLFGQIDRFGDVYGNAPTILTAIRQQCHREWVVQRVLKQRDGLFVAFLTAEK